MIDFQDAIIGPSSYDVVGITQDARVTVPRALKDRLLDIYMDVRAKTGPFDAEMFLKSYAIMSAQRACRLNGLWVRLLKRDNMPGYMRHMPRTLWHLSMAFEHPVTAPLRDWFKQARIPTAESPEV
jgi:aminoglycoside/choline kinase family phosphotransferase